MLDNIPPEEIAKCREVAFRANKYLLKEFMQIFPEFEKLPTNLQALLPIITYAYVMGFQAQKMANTIAIAGTNVTAEAVFSLTTIYAKDILDELLKEEKNHE